MKPWFRTIAVLAVLAPVAGCSFYFGDDDDDCDDAYYGDSGAPLAMYGIRNPETGVCESIGGGCGACGCDDVPAGDAEADPVSLPNWAECPGQCEGLPEAACLETAGCRGAYTGGYCPPWADCAPPEQTFLECWGTAPGAGTPVECWGLDAQQCSEHDDCAAVYNQDAGGALTFAGCQPETEAQGCYSDNECPPGYECSADTMCLPPPGCDPMGGGTGCEVPVPVCYGTCVPSQNSCAAVDCGPGYHCEEQCWPGGGGMDSDGVPADYCEPICVPDANSCAAVDCGPGYECIETCYPCDSPDGMGCPPVCQAQCVPILTCDNVLCDMGTHCELQCYPQPVPPGGGGTPDPTDPPIMDGCYPVCVPDTSNSCDLITCAPGTHCEETCITTDDDCGPSGTCSPPVCDAQCVPDTTTVTCESLTTEADCTSRPDCTAVYTGEDCECYPWGCTCQVLTYDRCETGWVIDPSPLARVGVRGRLEEIRASSAHGSAVF